MATKQLHRGQSQAKQDALSIITLTNKDRDFYPLIGPFLSRRAIVKELGGPLYDDDGMTWYVAFTPTAEVAGFAAVREQSVKSAKDALIVWLDNTYVLPEWREFGVYRQLLAKRLAAYSDGTTFRAVCTEKSLGPLQRRGFTVRRMRGQWAEVEWVKGSGKEQTA